MIPLSIKSQKSSVQQIRLKPKLDELKKKYGDDRNKYAPETQRLYQEEGVSMSGGCLPMLIRLPIMMSIYYLIWSFKQLNEVATSTEKLKKRSNMI